MHKSLQKTKNEELQRRSLERKIQKTAANLKASDWQLPSSITKRDLQLIPNSTATSTFEQGLTLHSLLCGAHTSAQKSDSQRRAQSQENLNNNNSNNGSRIPIYRHVGGSIIPRLSLPTETPPPSGGRRPLKEWGNNTQKNSDDDEDDVSTSSSAVYQDGKGQFLATTTAMGDHGSVANFGLGRRISQQNAGSEECFQSAFDESFDTEEREQRERSILISHQRSFGSAGSTPVKKIFVSNPNPIDPNTDDFYQGNERDEERTMVELNDSSDTLIAVADLNQSVKELKERLSCANERLDTVVGQLDRTLNESTCFDFERGDDDQRQFEIGQLAHPKKTKTTQTPDVWQQQEENEEQPKKALQNTPTTPSSTTSKKNRKFRLPIASSTFATSSWLLDNSNASKKSQRSERKDLARKHIDAVREHVKVRVLLLQAERRNMPAAEKKRTDAKKSAFKELMDEFDECKRNIKRELLADNVEKDVLSKHCVEIGRLNRATSCLQSKLELLLSGHERISNASRFSIPVSNFKSAMLSSPRSPHFNYSVLRMEETTKLSERVEAQSRIRQVETELHFYGRGSQSQAHQLGAIFGEEDGEQQPINGMERAETVEEHGDNLEVHSRVHEDDVQLDKTVGFGHDHGNVQLEKPAMMEDSPKTALASECVEREDSSERDKSVGVEHEHGVELLDEAGLDEPVVDSLLGNSNELSTSNKLLSPASFSANKLLMSKRQDPEEDDEVEVISARSLGTGSSTQRTLADIESIQEEIFTAADRSGSGPISAFSSPLSSKHSTSAAGRRRLVAQSDASTASEVVRSMGVDQEEEEYSTPKKSSLNEKPAKSSFADGSSIAKAAVGDDDESAALLNNKSATIADDGIGQKTAEQQQKWEEYINNNNNRAPQSESNSSITEEVSEDIASLSFKPSEKSLQSILSTNRSGTSATDNSLGRGGGRARRDSASEALLKLRLMHGVPELQLARSPRESISPPKMTMSPRAMERFMAKFPTNVPSREASFSEETASIKGAASNDLLLEELPNASQLGMVLDLSCASSDGVFLRRESLLQTNNVARKRPVLEEMAQQISRNYAQHRADYAKWEIDLKIEEQPPEEEEDSNGTVSDDVIPDLVLRQWCVECVQSLIDVGSLSSAGVPHHLLKDEKSLAQYLQKQMLSALVAGPREICSAGVKERASKTSHVQLDNNRLLLAQHVYARLGAGWPGPEAMLATELAVINALLGEQGE